MKKPVKWGIIVVGFLILLLIGLSIFLKVFLSGDRLKVLILPRAETATGRKVALDEIKISLFKGIVAKGLSVRERDGQRDFVKVKEFILSYQLLPLLKRQLVISKIELISPSISIKRQKEGRYNFNDLIEKKTPGAQKRHEAEHRGLPLSVITDRLFIRNGHFIFADETKVLPEISADLDVELKGTIGQEGTPRLEFGRISLKEMRAVTKDFEVKASGKIELDPKVIQADLQAVIRKENVEINATVKNYLSMPEVTANLHARSLDLEKLIFLKAGKRAPEGKPQVEEKRVMKAEEIRQRESPIQKLKASGRIAVDEAKYQDYRIKGFHLDYEYGRGMLKLQRIGSQFSGGDAFTMEGTLNGNLQMAMDGVSTIQKTLNGKGVVKLTKGRVRQSKIFDAIALLTGISALKNAEIEEGLLNLDIRDEKLNLDGVIRSGLFKVAPKGMVDFEKRFDITAVLKVSPTLTGGLAKSLAAIKFMDDEQGWKVVPLRIKGTMEKPHVTLDEEALKKQLGVGLKRELEKIFQKPAPEEEGKPSKKKTPKDLLRDLLGK
jgi:hypothetical protein